jgi:hypothetical protein
MSKGLSKNNLLNDSPIIFLEIISVKQRNRARGASLITSPLNLAEVLGQTGSCISTKELDFWTGHLEGRWHSTVFDRETHTL